MASAHYVNNPDFLKALKEYKEQVKSALESGAERPQVSRYVGECILKIATHLSYKPNFIGYSYRDEMISDGIENCLQYLDNFDPERGSNPFAYFTQIIWYAFIRRIQKEKKQTLIKGKIIMEMPFEAFEVQDHDDTGAYASSYVEFMQSHGIYGDIIAKDDKRKSTNKAKRQATLEAMLDSDEIVDEVVE